MYRNAHIHTQSTRLPVLWFPLDSSEAFFPSWSYRGWTVNVESSWCDLLWFCPAVKNSDSMAANILNVWFYIVTSFSRLRPSGALTLFHLRHWLSNRTLPPFHILIASSDRLLLDAHWTKRPVFVPRKYSMNVQYICNCPLICHALKGLWHYRIIECLLLPACFMNSSAGGPFQLEFDLYGSHRCSWHCMKAVRVICMHYCGSRRHNNHCGGYKICCYKKY